MQKITRLALCLSAATLGGLSGAAGAGEFRISEDVDRHGMTIGAVYLQPVRMTPMLPGMDAPTDIHLEADIHASEGNQNGFAAGDWIPYLQISYQLRKLGTDWSAVGSFTPMVASDGPHYGSNVRLDGPGKYQLRYHIEAPPGNGFYRHIDKETGVAPWWAPFDLDWQFTYLGTGKKGGY